MQIPEDLQRYLPSESAMKKQIRRKRKIENNITNEPESLEELEIPDEFKNTIDGTEFLRRIDLDTGSIFLFTTVENLEYLSKSSFWIMDGTFKTVPKLFLQLYSIHGRIGNNPGDPILPMVFVLMTSKSEEFYRILFQELEDLADKNEIVLKPGLIICDFELAAIQAARSQFENIRIQGCLFHLGQSIFRKIHSLKMVKVYNQTEELSLKIRMLAALAFLPANEIPEAFEKLRPIMPNEAQEIFIWFEIYYVKGRNCNSRTRGAPRIIPPLFSPELWSIYNQESGIPRTQNKVEAWHRRWNTLVGGAHVGIFRIINELKKEQNRTEIEIVKFTNFTHSNFVRNSESEKELRIQTIINSKDSRSLEDYLKALALRFIF